MSKMTPALTAALAPLKTGPEPPMDNFSDLTQRL